MSNCAFKDCYAVKTPCSKVTFFNLPIAPERREIWVKNAGPDNEKLQNLTEKSKRLFCEKHFDEKFMRRQFNRTTLHPTAVPNKYGAEFETEEEIENQNQNVMLMTDDAEVESSQNQPETPNESQEISILSISEPEVPQSPVMLNKSIKRRLETSNSEPVTLQTLKLKKVKLVGGKLVLPVKELPASKSNDIDNKCSESQMEVTRTTKQMASQTEVPSKVQTEDKFTQIEVHQAVSCEATTQTDAIPEEKTPASSKIDDEDVYFCVKVIGEAMKRLPPEKKGQAKLHMISYMFELEHSSSVNK